MEDYNDSEDELSAKGRAKLVEDVLSLNKRLPLHKPTRTEPSLKVSEFNLVKSVTGKQGVIHVNDLTKSLKKRAKHVEISKKFRTTERRAKILPKPLEKPQAQRIKRNLAYQNITKSFDRWDSIVTKNRSAHHLPFPIPSKLKLYTTGETIKEFNTRNAAETEEYPLTMKEILDRRSEIAKMRAVQSYKEAKARRQSKIKSKKYHRVKRKESVKKQMKEFEELQKTNPEEALKKLEEIERARAEERASLRHHSTGKWAKSKQVRAKYDKESRQVLAQQLSISRDLKQKVQTDKDSESDNETATSTPMEPVITNNPWTNPIQANNEVIDFVQSYKTFWEELNNKTTPNVSTDIKQPRPDITVDNTPDMEVQVGKVSSNTTDDLLRISKPKSLKKKELKQIPKREKSPKSRNPKNDVKYLGTTEREVEEFGIDDDSDKATQESIDVDDIFERYQKKLLKKINDKHKALKTNVTKTAPESHKIKARKAKKPKERNRIKPATPPINNNLNIDENVSKDNENLNQELQKLKSILSSGERALDKSKVAPVKTTAVNLNTDVPDLFSLEDNEENTDQKGVITEAFEDDDIVEEFHKEKQTEIDSEKPEDIDLNLPGWGSWGGTGIDPSKHKNKRLILKFPKKSRRRDDNKYDVFINEKGEQKIKKHMVSEVPFPFKTVKDFEASMRAPIGETFVPDLAFQKMIKPAVTTKMGMIIEPMSEDILID